ncbi:MAG: hypothetical protein ACLQBB_13165 [Solirubrobacteraceae bacterium]
MQQQRVSIVDAPGLASGPVITDAGLVWESPRGVVVTDAAGGSKVLAPLDARNWDAFVDLAWFGVNQWALARPSGVFAGQIGGALSELPQLRKCNPGSPAIPRGTAMYALSKGQLFAALPAPCFPASKAPLGVVLDINLHSRHSRVLARLPGTLEGVAASGRYVALSYLSPPLRLVTPPSSRTPSPEPRLFVRVLDAATGSLVNQIAPPAGIEAYGASAVQVDGRGDVLVTSGCGAVSPRQLAHIAQPPCLTSWWWAGAHSAVGHQTTLGSDAVLSDGRVAFLPSAGGGIDVRDLLDGSTRRVVAFAGSVRPLYEGLALSGTRLVWAQQSAVVNVVRTADSESCTPVPLSPVELASLNLADEPSSPVQMTGAPIPPQYANEPPCIEI